MSDLVLAACIASVPPTLAAVAALVVAMRGTRQLQALNLHINSRMDQLLEQTGKARQAEGRAEGVASERDRTTVIVEHKPS